MSPLSVLSFQLCSTYSRFVGCRQNGHQLLLPSGENRNRSHRELGGVSCVSSGTCLCVCVEPFQAHLRADGLKVEPSGAKMEGQLVKRESADNILAEEGDGMQMCLYVFTLRRRVHIQGFLSAIQEGATTTTAQRSERETAMRRESWSRT